MWFFLTEQQNALHSLTTSSWHQWLEKESLSATTQSTAEQLPLYEDQGGTVFRGAGLGSLVPACPQMWLVLNCHIPILQFHFGQSHWMGVPKQLGWAWICVNRLWALYSLKDVWKSYPRSCETKYWQRTAAALWGQQSAVRLLPALNMAHCILQSPAQTERAQTDLKYMGSIIHQKEQGVGIQNPWALFLATISLPCW